VAWSAQGVRPPSLTRRRCYQCPLRNRGDLALAATASRSHLQAILRLTRPEIRAVRNDSSREKKRGVVYASTP